LSLELIIKALIGLGLSRPDSEIYVYIAKKGPLTIMDLVNALIYDKQKIYSILRNLQTKGLVAKVQLKFSAISFEETLDLLIKMKKEQEQVMQESKEELLATWEAKDF